MKTLVILLLSTAVAFCQRPAGRGPSTGWQARIPSPGKADCSKTNSSGCGTFNEMLAANDVGLLAELSAKDNRIYVCFTPKEDVFHILRFPIAGKYGWNKRKGYEKQEAQATFCAFDRGQDAGCRTSFFAYTKVESETPHLNMSGSSFDSDEFSKERHSVTATDEAFQSLGASFVFTLDSRDAAISYKFINRAGGETSYGLLVRVSTGRFEETLESSNPTLETKEDGYCAKYGVVGPRLQPMNRRAIQR